MRKLFTLFALLTCFLGVKAIEIEDFAVDYTQVGTSTIGWKAEIITDDLITADAEGLHLNNPEVRENFYDYQLWIFNGAALEVEQTYTIKFVAKVSAGSADVRYRIGDWGGGIAGTITVNSTEYQEYEVSGAATVANSGLLVQFGDYVGTVSFKSIRIIHEGKEERPVEWKEELNNGDAEKSWAELGLADVKFDDLENNFKICAWSKQKGTNVNMHDDGKEGSDPFPAEIIEEADGNHAFIVRGAVADTEGDASGWDNQFWIQSPQSWKEGTELKIHFRYKASVPCKTNTQIHNQTPSNYKHWQAVGDVNFTTEWQEFDGTLIMDSNMANGWSIAFNLNPEVKDAVDFYFDDLSWKSMVLEEGLFITAANTTSGMVEYDFDTAEALTYSEDDEAYVITVGKAGDKDSWVNEVMISTVRGNSKAFKANTLKCNAKVDTWVDYTEGSNAKIKLPAAGVWTISVDNVGNQMYFEQVEGDIVKEPIEINPNPTVVVVKGQERDWLGTKDGNPIEEQVGEGQPWDNQFFIIANRALSAGEVTVVEFDYVSTVDAKTTTQCHNGPGEYMHWGCIGDVNFTTEEQHFSYKLTVPSEADGMKSIAFNMAEIKGACDYTIKNIVWKLEDGTESLIDQTGTKNFYVKEGAGTAPYEFGTDPENPGTGINSVVNGNAASGNIYNLNGQRVTNNFKGIVVKNGQKFVVE